MGTFKILIVLCMFNLFLICSLKAEETLDWENPEIFARNKEPDHATLMPYACMEEAMAALNSPYRVVDYSSFFGLPRMSWQFH